MAPVPDSEPGRTPRVTLLPHDRPVLVSLGIAAWSTIGVVALAAVVVLGLAQISSIVVSLLFAAVMAVLCAPLSRAMVGRGIPAAVAAGVILVGFVALWVGLAALTVRGVIAQSDRLGDELTAALRRFDIDDNDIAEIRDRLGQVGDGFGAGVMGSVTAGIAAVGNAVVGLLIGALAFYYLLRDGTAWRASLLERVPAEHHERLDRFVDETFFVLRRYWLGRAIVAAVVAVVVGVAAAILGLPLVATIVAVTFIGGFIPYVGAIVGGILAVVVALGSNGTTAALVMLGVVVGANVVIENLIEPAVTGRTLKVHPLVVLLATALGGTVAGIPGMVMATPLAVICQKALPPLRGLLAERGAGECA